MATEDTIEIPEPENQELLQDLSEKGNTAELVEMFEELPTMDVAEFMEEKPIEEVIEFLHKLDIEDQGRIFSDFSQTIQLKLFQALDRRSFAEVFAHMFSVRFVPRHDCDRHCIRVYFVRLFYVVLHFGLLPFARALLLMLL